MLDGDYLCTSLPIIIPYAFRVARLEVGPSSKIMLLPLRADIFGGYHWGSRVTDTACVCSGLGQSQWEGESCTGRGERLVVSQTRKPIGTPSLASLRITKNNCKTPIRSYLSAAVRVT